MLLEINIVSLRLNLNNFITELSFYPTNKYFIIRVFWNLCDSNEVDYVLIYWISGSVHNCYYIVSRLIETIVVICCYYVRTFVIIWDIVGDILDPVSFCCTEIILLNLRRHLGRMLRPFCWELHMITFFGMHFDVLSL